MEIKVCNAFEKNLKNISLFIPVNKMTAITGVSGSGKSTLLKNVLAAWGAVSFSKTRSGTIKHEMLINNSVMADSVEGLPTVLLIDVKSSVRDPFSTAATVSGIHEQLRNLFVNAAQTRCPDCGRVQDKDPDFPQTLKADIICGSDYDNAKEFLSSKGHIISESFFDKNMNPVKKGGKKSFAEIVFSVDTPSGAFIHSFNKKYGCRIVENSDDNMDPLLFSRCACGACVPRAVRTRFSYSTELSAGGGACRFCGGTGISTEMDEKKLILDSNKHIFDGGIAFVGEKGIKYTTVTEKFIQAAAKVYGIDISKKICEIPHEKLEMLILGMGEKIAFSDRIGGKKELEYKGIAGFLKESFLSGKGKSALEEYITQSECPHCGGTRFDKLLDSLTLDGVSIRGLYKMTFSQLYNWCSNLKIGGISENIADRIRQSTANITEVSCGHLQLRRASRTLSGGELQRIRISTMLNSGIRGVCYLLDEPSSGLHINDIDRIARLLGKLCRLGNTVIMVEHEPRMISVCDYIVDMGPVGGSKGGQVLISDDMSAVGKYDTKTSKLLADPKFAIVPKKWKEPNGWLNFSELNFNNLKNLSVRIPLSRITAVCGVSGSGKSTLLRMGIYSDISSKPLEYGFKEIVYLSQNNSVVSALSCISTFLGLAEHIAKLFSKQTSFSAKCFLPNSLEGKCSVCGGKGRLFSNSGEDLGICGSCEGKKYSEDVLSARVNGLNISELMSLSLSELGEKSGDKRLRDISEMSTMLGIGYLTLSSGVNSLSKGEYQRVRLAGILSEKKTDGMYLLDEPSKGLHSADKADLIKALGLLTQRNNTVVFVEHDPLMILNSDYVVELKGTGDSGGVLGFYGSAADFSKTDDAAQLLAVRPHEPAEQPRCDNPLIAIGTEDSFRTDGSIPLEHTGHKELIKNAAKLSEDLFLRNAIPNNVFFSMIKDHDLSLDSPLIQYISFNEQSRYDTSIYEVLGIKQYVIREASEQYPDTPELVRCFFDDRSMTGKCGRCGGTGSITGVDLSFFTENGKLTKNCMKFLNNSTHFKDIRMQIKKETGADIGKPVSEMTDEESDILFYGCGSGWDGLVQRFLNDHKYYPDERADAVIVAKHSMVCPRCGGKMVSDDYKDLKVFGMGYAELIQTEIKQLAKKLRKCGSSPQHQKILYILDTLIKCGGEKLRLSDKWNSINAPLSGIIKLLSAVCDPISGTYVALSDTEELDGNCKQALYEIIKPLEDTTRIIII